MVIADNVARQCLEYVRTARANNTPVADWLLTGPHIHLYVRYTLETCEHPATFTIATIRLEKRQRGRGWFTDLVASLERDLPAYGVNSLVVERASTRLSGWCATNGFTVFNTDSYRKALC